MLLSSLSNLNFTYFMTAFAIGLLFAYVFAPAPQVVVKFPSPYNAGRVTYRDSADNCYKFRAEKQEECPSDPKLVRGQPITEDFSNRNRAHPR